MSWRDYANIIRNRGGSIEEWEAAASNNPNNPEAALKVAILQTIIDPKDMQALESLCAAVISLARQAAAAAAEAADDEDDEINPWLLHGEELERTEERVKAGWPI